MVEKRSSYECKYGRQTSIKTLSMCNFSILNSESDNQTCHCYNPNSMLLAAQKRKVLSHDYEVFFSFSAASSCSL